MKTETASPPPNPAHIRATAWALGQLSPEETTAFAAEMVADPDLAAYAREMQEFSHLIAAEFTSEEKALGLPQASRERLVSALRQAKTSPQTKPPHKGFLRTHWKSLGLTTAAAAGIILTLRPAWIAPLSNPTISGAKTVAAETSQVLAADSSAPITIRPTMPKPLFVGTPLPQNDAPPNMDQSKTPTLEVKVPAGTTLISQGKPVTSNDSAPIGDLSLITDGDKAGDDGYFVDLGTGKIWIQIDLGASHEIWLLWVWHFHRQNVLYNDVIAQISDDPSFQTAVTVFNNDYDNSSGLGIGKDLSYLETNNGRPMPVNGVKGRYVRLFSNGRDLDDTNQYIEVEVYGRKAGSDPLRLAQSQYFLLSKNHSPEMTNQGFPSVSMFPLDALQPAAADGEPPAPSKALAGPETSIRPAMPKPLFVGTPLPQHGMGGPRLLSSATELDKAPTPSRQKIDSRYRFNWTSQPGAIRTLPGEEAPTERPYRLYDGGLRSLDLTGTTESYKPLPPNPFNEVIASPLSTFSIDVDTASYANVRRFLNAGQRPPKEAVRLEELVNYFPYEETPPQDGKPFAVKVDVTSAPWNPAHRLARVALKGKEIASAQRPPSNLVFLVDVSGSMKESNRLPLVQQSLRLLTERLTENDHVSIVVYAGNTGVVLPSTNGQEKGRIQNAIDGLTSGGSTNGAGGITAAYEQATAHFIKDGVNRVILATDGDFNVGASSHAELLTLIQEKAKTGVFLSVLGYGMGNLKDDTMELLADKGNGNYGYIDSLSEARKTLVEQMSGTLVTIAKDVKIQIEFNPAAVKSYRLLGYENRLLAKEDFNDDKKDAGEIGAGHNVTALYEIIPAGAPDAAPVPVVDGLKYQQVPAVVAPKTEPTPAAQSGEMMNVKLRWKQPAGEVSELLEVPVKDAAVPLDQAPQETRWATAVAGFAQLLRGDAPPTLTWESVRQLARSAKGNDALGYRGEFLQLIDKAESLSR